MHEKCSFDKIAAMKKTKKVVAAILYRKAASGVEIFAARRNHGEFTGFWEFPGGKVEAGETAETALYREVREELVADIIIEKSFTVVEFEYPDFHLSMECFLCRFKSDFQLTEHSDAKWLPVHKLKSVEWLPADIQIIEKLQRYDYF